MFNSCFRTCLLQNLKLYDVKERKFGAKLQLLFKMCKLLRIYLYVSIKNITFAPKFERYTQ